MKLAVITPVGPGHQGCVKRAIESVAGRGRFSSVEHVVIDDTCGEMGRGAARNAGMIDADWYFFLDADDTMHPDALGAVNLDKQATFGSVRLNHGNAKNVHPCGWREVALYGARGTLSMGFFCRADVARRLRFNEAMDAGEDFDFYLRLDSFAKIEQPLVIIGYDVPSATGPRGYVRIDWVGICNKLITAAVANDPAKYDLRGDAVLAQAGSPEDQC
jgi:glycosyltransferase involved in cell wall biosynthesis